MSAIFNTQLYEVLKDLDVISGDHLEAAYKDSSPTKSLGEILLDKDLISDDNLGKITADLHGISFVDFDSTPVDFDVFSLIPENIAKKHSVVAFRISDNVLHLAMHHPDNIFIVEAIEKKTGYKTKIYYATKSTINNVLSEYAKDFASAFNTLIQEYQTSKEAANKKEELEAPIIKSVDMIFNQSYKEKASDVHIEPEDEVTILRFRIDGILKDIVKIPKELHDQIVTRIKVMAGMRTDEHQSPQDGKLHFLSESDKVDVRVSIVPTTQGEKIVMRLLSDKSRRLSLTDLGFGANDLKKVKNAAAKPYGMILATGPTGSGKTTTLYSMVKILNKPDINIMTIEDPVEYAVERVNQIQVNNKAHLTFSEGLKSIVRQDPDIILVGEIRDEETASIAINSAMTGHLVLSSVHTNDAATAIPRLIDMDIEPFLVASSVNLIVAQRLVRKLCQNCIVSKQVEVADIIKTTGKVKRGDGPSLTISQSLVSKHFPNQDKIRVYEGKGCEVCHQSGYTGRIGIFEVLEVSEEIKDLIAQKADASEIEQKAVEQGMGTMFDDGLQKVKQGQTSLEEIMRVAKE